MLTMSSSEERGSIFHTQGGAVFQNITASRDININHITQIRPLADEINASFFDSPEIFNNVQNELIGLISAIGIAHTRYPDFLDDEDFPALGQELKSCRRTLLDLQRLKQRYDDLPSKSKFNWERTEMSFNSLAEMRARISLSRENVTLLTTTMIACSQVNVERQLRKLLEEHSDEGSVVSSLSSGSLSLSDNEAWEKIRKELQDVGMTPRAFDKNRTFILQFLEQAISEGDLIPGFEPGSQLKEAGSESIEPGSTAEKDREMTKLVTFTPTKRSNGLSRLVYRLTTSRNKFIQAAADGDLSLVMRSLDMNVDVDCHNEDGESALMRAASNGHEKIVEVLVAHGAAWKACSGEKKDCNTALCNAAAKGYTRVIELILEGGGLPDWCRGRLISISPPPSPLAVAASYGQIYAV
ncbi:hypothetical protein N7528_009311 [Penicillium herquei]|nr:hypothetical protein N7528_009311 [Penicillium herquei]